MKREELYLLGGRQKGTAEFSDRLGGSLGSPAVANDVQVPM
jgi:hypothetical protein